ncbi:hypothetical protein [Cohnella soli]|uniref:Uncharacterized protein n=1 Tax=Cohnella soli TaxID=425005 RepID=A0ABW0HPD8_9BACL
MHQKEQLQFVTIGDVAAAGWTTIGAPGEAAAARIFGDVAAAGWTTIGAPGRAAAGLYRSPTSRLPAGQRSAHLEELLQVCIDRRRRGRRLANDRRTWRSCCRFVSIADVAAAGWPTWG